MHWSGSLVFHWVHLTFLFNITFLAAILPSSMLLTLLGDMDNKFDSSLTKALHYPDIWNNLFTWHLGGTTSVQTLVMVTLYQSCTSPATKTKCELRRWYWWPCEVGGWGAPCFGGRTISFLVIFQSSVLCSLVAYIGHSAYFIQHLIIKKPNIGLNILKNRPQKQQRIRKCHKTANIWHVFFRGCWGGGLLFTVHFL